MAERRDLLVDTGEQTLAGSLWLTESAPLAVIVMYAGSGPSDRHNDGYFVPLRDELLHAGYAVASFDKRGVGSSTGRWQDAPIETQARDLLACVDRLRSQPGVEELPIGIYGHSQGGWVVVEAAARSDNVAFVIINAGPAVTPAEQERYAARRALEDSGASAEEAERGLARFDLVARLARALTPWDEVEGRREELAPHLPADSLEWRFWISILDYDPKSPLSRSRAPLLVLYGEADRLVPVEESVRVLSSIVPPTRLTIEVFPGANHRVQVGDPPEMAPGYVEAVLHFLQSNAQS